MKGTTVSKPSDEHVQSYWTPYALPGPKSNCSPLLDAANELRSEQVALTELMAPVAHALYVAAKPHAWYS